MRLSHEVRSLSFLLLGVLEVLLSTAFLAVCLLEHTPLPSKKVSNFTIKWISRGRA